MPHKCVPNNFIRSVVHPREFGVKWIVARRHCSLIQYFSVSSSFPWESHAQPTPTSISSSFSFAVGVSDFFFSHLLLSNVKTRDSSNKRHLVHIHSSNSISFLGIFSLPLIRSIAFFTHSNRSLSHSSLVSSLSLLLASWMGGALHHFPYKHLFRFHHSFPTNRSIQWVEFNASY